MSENELGPIPERPMPRLLGFIVNPDDPDEWIIYLEIDYRVFEFRARRRDVTNL